MPVNQGTCPHPETVERWASSTQRTGSFCARCGVPFASVPAPDLERYRTVYLAAEEWALSVWADDEGRAAANLLGLFDEQIAAQEAAEDAEDAFVGDVGLGQIGGLG